MKKTLVSGALAGTMALLLSSCFALQSFSILATSIRPGGATKAQFVLHPLQEAAMLLGTNIRNRHQFVIVGVPDSGDLTIGKATWGTNGKFGGPVGMPVSPGFEPALEANGICASSGLDLAAMTTVTWKAFLTNGTVNDKGKVDTKAVVQVIVRATAGAGTGSSYPVFGITGGWIDEGTVGVDSGDSFYCTGVGSANIYVKA